MTVPEKSTARTAEIFRNRSGSFERFTCRSEAGSRAFRHAREMSPDASGFNLAVNALVFAARFVLDTYPGSLMTPAFAVAGLCTTVAGLWLGKPPLASALLPWIAITIAVAGFGLSSGETTLTGLASAWPFYLSDAVIACLCWALARPFW